jgi:hypothetical protein
LTAMGSMVEAAAKEQQRQSGSDRKSDKAKSVEPLSAKPIHVADEVAAQASVAASTVKQAKKVKDAATSLAAEVVAGATSLNDAYRQVRSKPVQNHL